MSLLMEALKKAERAKQGQSSLNGETAEQPNTAEPSEELALLPAETHQPAQGARNQADFPAIFDADEETATPELSLLHEPAAAPAKTEPSPAETISDKKPEPASTQPGPKPAHAPEPGIEAQPEPALKPAMDSQSRPAPHTAAAHRAPARDDRKIAAQQKAKTVFAAKQSGNNRGLLLGAAAAALVIGAAAFGYYYWQIVSGSTVTQPSGMAQLPPAQAPQPAATAPALTDPGAGAVALASADAAPTQVSLKPDSTPPQNESAAFPAREERPAAPSVADKPAIQIRQNAATNHLNPLLGGAYQAFQSGNLEQAQQQYRKVLQQEPNNRDALLGLAALSLNKKQYTQATAYYAKLLELDPADPDALAGFVGLQGQSDPVQSESRLKSILAQNPQASALHFALGNLYTQQSRWAEAQQSYFRAYSKAPGNADYAFNLAVSLDSLSQGKLALEYYQRALALAQSGPASFDKASAQNRAQELQATPPMPQPAGN